MKKDMSVILCSQGKARESAGSRIKDILYLIYCSLSGKRFCSPTAKMNSGKQPRGKDKDLWTGGLQIGKLPFFVVTFDHRKHHKGNLHSI